MTSDPNPGAAADRDAGGPVPRPRPAAARPPDRAADPAGDPRPPARPPGTDPPQESVGAGPFEPPPFEPEPLEPEPFEPEPLDTGPRAWPADPGADAPGPSGPRPFDPPAGAGFVVVAVTGDLRGVDWAHTAGLHRDLGHPELVLVGLPAPVAAAVLEQLAETVLRGVRLRAGVATELGELRLRLVDVDPDVAAAGEWFRVGRALLGRLGDPWPPTLQVLWAVADGGFPDETGRPVVGVTPPQPLLSRPPSPRAA